VPAVDNDGKPYMGCARCVVGLPSGRFSLRKLLATQRRVDQLWRDKSYVHPFTDEQLAIIAYALGVLSASRLAAGERLEEFCEWPR